MTKRYATYLRRSSMGEEDKNFSLGDQRNLVEDYGRKQDFEHVQEYSDPGGKSYKLNRPVLQQLMRDAKERKFDVVVVARWDRFSRVQDQAAVAVHQLRQYGVEVVSATQPTAEGALGTFMRNTYAFAAELELYNIRERLMGGRRGRSAAGKISPAPYPLYGYLWGDPEKGQRSYYVEDPETAPIVRLVYTLILSGMTMRGVAAKLERDGIPTPMQVQQSRGKMPKNRPVSRSWRLSTLRRMLSNPAYCGRHSAWRHEIQTIISTDPVTGEEIEVARIVERHEDDAERVFFSEAVCPALVSMEQFEKVKVILDQHRVEASRNLADPEAGLLRSGIAHCGYCGRKLQIKWSKPNQTYRYWCGIAHGVASAKDRCEGGGFSWKASELDGLVWDWMCHQLRNPDLLREKFAAWQEEQKTGQSIEYDRIASLDAQIKRGKTRRENFLASMADAADEEDRQEYKARAELEKKSIAAWVEEREALTQVLTQQDTFTAAVENVIEAASRASLNLDGATYDSKRFTLRAFGVRVMAKKKPDFTVDWRLSVPNQVAYGQRMA